MSEFSKALREVMPLVARLLPRDHFWMIMVMAGGINTLELINRIPRPFTETDYVAMIVAYVAGSLGLLSLAEGLKKGRLGQILRGGVMALAPLGLNAAVLWNQGQSILEALKEGGQIASSALMIPLGLFFSINFLRMYK